MQSPLNHCVRPSKFVLYCSHHSLDETHLPETDKLYCGPLSDKFYLPDEHGDPSENHLESFDRETGFKGSSDFGGLQSLWGPQSKHNTKKNCSMLAETSKKPKAIKGQSTPGKVQDFVLFVQTGQ